MSATRVTTGSWCPSATFRPTSSTPPSRSRTTPSTRIAGSTRAPCCGPRWPTTRSAVSSMLAGLPQAPTQYNPLINLPAAKKRQLDVLKAMVENHFITQKDADAAYATKLQIHPPVNRFEAPYFVDYVLKTLGQQYKILPGD